MLLALAYIQLVIFPLSYSFLLPKRKEKETIRISSRIRMGKEKRKEESEN